MQKIVALTLLLAFCYASQAMDYTPNIESSMDSNGIITIIEFFLPGDGTQITLTAKKHPNKTYEASRVTELLEEESTSFFSSSPPRIYDVEKTYDATKAQELFLLQQKKLELLGNQACKK